MTNGKEWVTIKIPKQTRDDAKDDPRTYEEIMQAGINHNPEKIQKELEEMPPVDIEETVSSMVDATREDIEEVLGRLDDLEASIPSKTADELEGRIR